MDLTKLDENVICRICLSDDTGDLNSIFTGSRSIPNAIMSFADVQILENDGLPDLICSNCLIEVNIACVFKEKCEKSDKILRSKLENSLCIVKIENPIQLPTTNNSFDELFSEERNCLSNRNDTCNSGGKSGDTNGQNEYLTANVYEEELEDDPEREQEEELEEIEQVEQQSLNENDSDLHGRKRGRPKKDSIENGKVKLQCSDCDETFEKKIDLKRHRAVDHVNMDGEKTLECVECKKMYSTEQHLTIHMKTHNRKIYDCDDCEKKFPRLDILVEHKKRHTNERSYLCTNCGKGFYNQTYLDRHMQIHTKEKPVHQCMICGKTMAHSNHLMVHMRAHKDRTGPMIVENKNNILCSVCGKSCSSRSNLAVHMRRHTGKMTNFCSVCGKGYPRTTDLTIHMRQHTGEKPFRCQVCKRRFARSDKLAIHMRTHTGEKPYVCSICGRAFAQSNDLASHKRRNACSNNSGPIGMDPASAMFIETPQIHIETNDNNISIVQGIPTLSGLRTIADQRIATQNNLPNGIRIVNTEQTPMQQCNNSEYPTATFLPNFSTSSFR